MRIISTLVFAIGASLSLQGCSVSTEDLGEQAQEILKRKDFQEDERKSVSTEDLGKQAQEILKRRDLEEAEREMLKELIEPVHKPTSTSTERRTISRILRKIYGTQDLTIPSESEVRKVLGGQQIDEAEFKKRMSELRSNSNPAFNRAVVLMVEVSKAGFTI